MESDDRCKFHKEILEKSGANLPVIAQSKFLQDKETVFDYYVDVETNEWKIWSPPEWKAPRKIVFSQLLIPTSDSVRAEYIIDRIAQLPNVRHPERQEQGFQHTLLVGAPGTAKTSIVLMYAGNFDGDKVSFKRLNFSSATKPGNFQQGLMAELTRVQAKTYKPHNNKELVVFMDDFSMPKINTWLDQETLEIARQVIEQRGLYSLDPDEAGNLLKFEKLKYLAAMRHPTGGRNNIPTRAMRHFFCINCTPTSNRSVQNIYGQILDAIINPKKKYEQKVIAMKSLIIDATIVLWETVRKRMMPTPKKFHYEFNIRDLSRIFQGVARVAQAVEYKVI
jgi:dynein heavy chain